jgi:hypothetical protein
VVIHVAARRNPAAAFDALPDPVPCDPHDQAAFARWFERSQDVIAILDGYELEPIGLPHDGRSWYYLSHAEAAEIVDYLEALGYFVPAGVAASLREDAQLPGGATS